MFDDPTEPVPTFLQRLRAALGVDPVMDGSETEPEGADEAGGVDPAGADSAGVNPSGVAEPVDLPDDEPEG